MRREVRTSSSVAGRLTLGLVIALLAACESAPRRPDFIELRKPGGGLLRVPLGGPGSNPESTAVARRVQEIDAELEGWRAAHPSADHQVAAALTGAARELRDEAVWQLDLAYRVAERTSGPLDAALVLLAGGGADEARKVLRSPPPASAFVETRITAASGDAALRYMTAGEHRSGTGSWSTYNPGQRLRIGRYVFRIETTAGTAPWVETLLVIEDPTVRQLTQPR
jgi:hypothetical protein